MLQPRHFATALGLLGLLASGAAWSQPYALDTLREVARRNHPTLSAARDARDASEARIQSAAAHPNPELELLSGSTRARVPGATTGASRTLTLTQRLDYPAQRELRTGAARAGLDAAQAAYLAVERDLLAELALRFHDLARRMEERAAAEESAQLFGEIRRRVGLRVETGEAARYELIKADAETLNAQKALQSAQLRVEQARASLRSLVGPELPQDFTIAAEPAEPQPRSLDELQGKLAMSNPAILRSRALLEQARQTLELERARRLPEISLRAVEDRDPEVRNLRAGVVLSIPLWDRRQGPIAEAAAEFARSRSELDARALQLRHDLEVAWRQYEIARNQLSALEGGILREAESALRVAEAAYRHGERGILDYLDAQRVFRAARNELIAARFELRVAAIEIERLSAQAPNPEPTR